MKNTNARLVALRGSIFAIVCVAVSASTISAQKLSAAETEKIIALRARTAILALKTKNLARLAPLVHPTKGLRFSPYYHINIEKGGDRVVTRAQARTLFANNRRFVWGEDDVTGEKLRMTFTRYYRRFVYDKDFARAQVNYGDQFYGRGTLINNMAEVYPNAIFVEYHFPGFEEKYGGMDWRSLWFVFEKDGSQWYLVGIAHGEWTS